MNMQDHWQAIYDAARAALDAIPEGDEVALLHVFSGDSQTGESHEAPFVAYRQEVERSTGTTGAGSLKVLRSNWLFTAYTKDLGDGLLWLSTILNALTDATFTTTDGYTTTNINPLGVQTLYEDDVKLYACHLRLEWERSL